MRVRESICMDLRWIFHGFLMVKVNSGDLVSSSKTLLVAEQDPSQVPRSDLAHKVDGCSWTMAHRTSIAPESSMAQRF